MANGEGVGRARDGGGHWAVYKVGQNRIYTPYMTVYLLISLPKIPYIHRINMVLANPSCVVAGLPIKELKELTRREDQAVIFIFICYACFNVRVRMSGAGASCYLVRML